MATLAAQNFNPVTRLGLVNPDRNAITCVGYAPTQGRRCRNPIAKHNINSGLSTLQSLHLGLAQNTRLQRELEDAASCLLCRHYHQDQAESVARAWSRTIQRHTGAAQNAAPPHHGNSSGMISRWPQLDPPSSSAGPTSDPKPKVDATSAKGKERMIEPARAALERINHAPGSSCRQLEAINAKPLAMRGPDDESCTKLDTKKSLKLPVTSNATFNTTLAASSGSPDLTKPIHGSEASTACPDHPVLALPTLSSGSLSLVSASSADISDETPTDGDDVAESDDWQDHDPTPEPSDIDENDMEDLFDSDEEIEAAGDQLQHENDTSRAAMSSSEEVQQAESSRRTAKGKQPVSAFEPSTPAPRQSTGRDGYRPSTSPPRSTPPKIDWATAWTRYERSWAALARQDASSVEGSLLHTLPWPVAGGSHRDVSEATVEDFFTVAPGAIVEDDAAYARMMKRQALKWRPERLTDRFGQAKMDQSRVMKLVTLVHDVVSSLV